MLLFSATGAEAQEFFNLTAEQVRIDSLLPVFAWQKMLGVGSRDSLYTVSIDYPEFIDMSDDDILRYRQVSGAPLPEMPEVTCYVATSRKQQLLNVSFVPLVFRNGRYQKLVSFMLRVNARLSGVHIAKRSSLHLQPSTLHQSSSTPYASHSLLASGTWVKIRVSESGIYQLTDALVKKAGFSDPAKVRVYGYGGALQPERLTADYLSATDDLTEVSTATVGGKRLFWAVGPVGWESAEGTRRIRNPYSRYGYYFLTEGDESPLTISAEQFINDCQAAYDNYHALYEPEEYAWYHGGRNLYEKSPFTIGTPRNYTFSATGSKATLAVALTYDADFEAAVMVNDSLVGNMSATVSLDQYTHAAERVWEYDLQGIVKDNNTVTITQTAGGTVRMDYLSLTLQEPTPLPDMATATMPVPEYVGRVANQDRHADEVVDMVILIPTSRVWQTEAERLKAWHEENDGLSVRIVSADELYNEFSSGTPDATAYRRYMKMLYDRAGTDGKQPRYLLLFGDGAWDNRMLSADWTGESPDNYLLCFESDNSFSAINCYVSDDFFCLLDDEEEIETTVGGAKTYRGMPDVAVGRLSVRTLDEAKVQVDKIIGYAANTYAGSWQNTVCVMGDDGNGNSHMSTADRVATLVETNRPGYTVEKIYWDAYPMTTTSTGNSYPDVTRLIKQRMTDGALLMNYSGHGAAYALSHELVVKTADFAEATSLRLPLWLTASCDIMPFDGQEENIGETAMANKRGGAIAFFGTTRTVYAQYNEKMNMAFTGYVLGTATTAPLSIGEAVRQAKCDLVSTGGDTTPNKLQYTLLGDPALMLAVPTLDVLIDSINGQAISTGSTVTLPAGSIVSVKGHIAAGGQPVTDFQGVVIATVRDAEETITCRLNNTGSDGAETPFVYKDHTKTIYHGADSVGNGRFSFSFAVPRDISYTEGKGLMTLYAVDNAKAREAHGRNESFVLNGSGTAANDSIGPSIYCYLNTPSFPNGGRVNPTPYFVAELYDDSGINASGSSIGHDLELIIDGEMSRTYNLNSSFAYDFGDYRSGTARFSIPELAEGKHRLQFRAWDVLNNSSTATLDFEVVKGEAGSISVDCTRNPATNHTTFLITHDRAGTELTVGLDIYDTSGRHLWTYSETGQSTTNTYTLDWDLTIGGGRPLMTGVYIYRIRVSSNGSNEASQAKKLIVVNNK